MYSAMTNITQVVVKESTPPLVCLKHILLILHFSSHNVCSWSSAVSDTTFIFSMSSLHLGCTCWKVSIVLGVRKKGQGECLFRSDCLATHLSLFQGHRLFAFWEGRMKKRKTPLLLSPGVGMSCWPLLKGTFFPLKNSHWVAVLCPQQLLCAPLGVGAAFQGAPRAA